MADTIFRSALHGCWRQITTPYGCYLAPARDPLADGEIPEEALTSFQLHDDPPVIPAELWSAWIKLAFHFVKGENGVEVGARIMRHAEHHDQWRFLIPRQLVDGASVEVASTDNAIDLLSGEVVATYPPEDWVSFGSTHSHNTMSSFFSPVDDSTELGDPGLHIVIGDVNPEKMTYTLKASITAHRKRYIIDHDKVLDTTPQTTDFHPAVLSNVGHTPLRQYAYSSSQYNWLPKGRKTRRWSESQQQWLDGDKDINWLNDQLYGADDHELFHDERTTEDLVDMRQQINSLYDKIMDIQDRRCRTSDHLERLYYQLESVIETMEYLLAMDLQASVL
jgi:hypothetical protein